MCPIAARRLATADLALAGAGVIGIDARAVVRFGVIDPIRHDLGHVFVYLRWRLILSISPALAGALVGGAIQEVAGDFDE